MNPDINIIVRFLRATRGAQYTENRYRSEDYADMILSGVWATFFFLTFHRNSL